MEWWWTTTTSKQWWTATTTLHGLDHGATMVNNNNEMTMLEWKEAEIKWIEGEIE